ncbi:MAG: fused MFS/spermidine synthase [bacterium]|nr:fused MFS/spermidine synthase [bacterium]
MPTPRPPSSLLLAMAVGSGLAALIYQVVWMRRLALVFGSTTLATSTVLVAFLGGLAVGAWVWGRVADRRPGGAIALFGLVEVATGLYGLASPWIFRGMEIVYLGLYPVLEGRPGLYAGAQFVLSALVILPPTVLMGGTVPLLVRHLAVGAGGTVRGVGSLYGWNTVGAAMGAALAAYGLLPFLGLSAAVRLAASVNLVIGAVALLLDAVRRRGLQQPARAGGTPGTGRLPEAGFVPEAGLAPPDPVTVFVVLQGFGLSGFAAMTFEVAWARLLAMVMGSSVYAFGTIVVVVLAGIGIGSVLYGRMRLTPGGHVLAFAVIELLIGLWTVVSLLIAPQLPFLFMRFFPVFRDAFGWQIAAQIGLAGLVGFVPALLWGATFPAVVGIIGPALSRVGRSIGTAYAANTAGTVAGAYLSGFVLIPAVGVRATILAGALANLLAGISVLLRAPLPWRRRLPAMAPAAAALLIALTLPPWPREVFAAGIGFFAPRFGSVEGFTRTVAALRLLYYRDGINSTISVDETEGQLIYRSNGKTDASTYPSDMANQLLLGHLPMLLHPAPQDVFVLGLGTAVTAAAVARYPVRRIDVVEIEPAAREAARLFGRHNQGVLDDPRLRILVADGRNRLLAAADRYDVVISDPSDLWVAGTGTLFTLEFYRAVRARLRPGGVMIQWIHTHTLAPPDLALLVGTFRSVFTRAELWTSGVGDLLLIGSTGQLNWDQAQVADRMEKVPGVREDLRSIGIWHPLALFAGHMLGEPQIAALTLGLAGPHTDDRPVMEFRTPRLLYADTTAEIETFLSKLGAPSFPRISGFESVRDLDADAIYLIGFAYASLGRPKLGIPYMERSTAMAPERAAFFLGLANQYREVGRVRDAEQAYGRALALEPGNVEALVALGEVLLEAGQAGRALALAQRALRLAPNDLRAGALAERARGKQP